MRIVQVTALGLSARCFLGEHFRALTRQGYEVILVCSDDQDANAVANQTGIRFIPINVKQNTSPLSDLVSLWRMTRLLKRLNPALVHAHMSKAGLMGSLAAWLSGVPVRVYHNHGMAMLSSRGARRLLLKCVEWATNRLATHVVFCGESTRAAALDAAVALSQKTRVLGDGTISGVDTARFAPDPTGRRREVQREAWGVEAQKVVVGFVGRIVPHKGVATLLEAWRKLDPATRQRACLVMLGGFGHPGLERMVAAAEAEDIGLRNIGWCEDMVSAYEAMDLLVLPSWHEGFPYSLLEAQCMGLPVIASRATGNVDAVQHERTGLLTPVRDAGALAEAMTRLIHSDQDRSRLGAAARGRVLERFSQDLVLANMLAFYEELLHLHPARPCPDAGAGHSEPTCSAKTPTR